MTSWIFQGNPKIFRVNEYLRSRKKITWTVRQKHFKDDITIDDEVYIWRSDGRIPKSGGIVARGKVISSPCEMRDDAPELWIEKPKDPIALRVQIEVEDVRLTKEQGMIKRVDMEKDEQIKDMRILVFRSETNYLLEPRHANHIRNLWRH